MGQVVLVTGVSRYLGGRMARMLTDDPRIDRVIGVDVVPPRTDIGRAEFARADIRNPIISKVIAAADVDTVVHMGVIATPVQAGGRMAMKEINVIGTMQLLAACQKSPSIRRLVVKSTSSVYGAGSQDPAMFTEGTEPRHAPESGWAKDSVEVEGYVRGFARRRPDVVTTTLRFANFIGPIVQTPMTAYFTLPLVPVVTGFDARLQFIHEDDGLAAIHHAAVDDYPGLFNIAGDGVIALSQAIRLAGRLPFPVPPLLVGGVGRAVIRLGLADFSPEQVRFLTFGRGVDTTRMREVLEFVPEYTTREAFMSFVEGRGLNRVLKPERVASVEQSLTNLLTRKGAVNA
ncbi:MAG: NAD-dependent epimerase/dehydratase family protein [Candidatus Nanopelagicales bacterium]|nr:NAD-dependent epimerase/dehydratase family protein [Candidatus Nanopelagicales bacterium]